MNGLGHGTGTPPGECLYDPAFYKTRIYVDNGIKSHSLGPTLPANVTMFGLRNFRTRKVEMARLLKAKGIPCKHTASPFEERLVDVNLESLAE